MARGIRQEGHLKLPSFLFYPGDWQKEPNLRRCSLAAKGALIEILCLAFELEERGVLISGGKPWSDKEVAEALGGNLDVAVKSVSELISKGVIKRRADGALYSAKMVRDETIRKKRAEGGRLGGNPQLKPKVNLSHNLTDNLPPEDETEDEKSPPKEKGYGEKPRFKLPQNESQAVEWCAIAGVPGGFAKRLYHQCEGTGWLDGLHRNITSFASYAKYRFELERGKGPNGKLHTPHIPGTGSI